ncbi:Fucose permease [Rhizobium mongolense subsp. loessense]|uniref:Fucose permease n=2 Tax=Rhizobium mongolense TaxID=57676 RepID=A0A1G4U5V6_9HYPH|nr:Fucose permease [Rhizobium mongolense subsp. loessense]
MNLEKGTLGLVLLCFALGAIVLMTNFRRLSQQCSCHALCLFGSVGFGIALVSVPHVANVYLLALIVFMAGAGFGTLDVSMNTEASLLERQIGHHIMSSFHAVFSIGNLAGAFVVGQLLNFGAALAVCLGVTGAIVMVLSVAAYFGVQGYNQDTTPIGARTISADRIEGRVYLYFLGAISFLALFAEGGMMDWSAIYIVGTLHGTESTGAYGFAAFAATMTIGRLVGDAITNRVGPTNVLRFGAIICAVSVAALLSIDSISIALIALGGCGFGVANIVPAVFAAAGRAGGSAAANAMSIVTTMGYSGLLLGPAVLGLVAQMSTLSVSMSLLVLAFSAIVVSTYYLRDL